MGRIKDTLLVAGRYVDASPNLDSIEWESKTGSGYKNKVIIAEIVDVQLDGENIILHYLSADGMINTISDFGFNGLVVPVYKYLVERAG